MDDLIQLHKASTNNLKAIDVGFPIGKISVVTGVSGSGKSSLVFDTLYGEAYRRYVESLSSFARQYLKALPKPDIEEIYNLPPAISVRQTRSGASGRSTVGTLSEINDLLRVIFTQLSEVWCANCDLQVRKDTAESIYLDVAGAWPSDKALICAPLSTWGKITAKDLKAALEAQGFTRIITADQELMKIHDAKATQIKSARVVIDRITLNESSRSRIIDGIGLALKVGRGHCEIYVSEAQAKLFSSELTCTSCGTAYHEPSTALFSYNHPLGACQACQGFGMEAIYDWDQILPDPTSSLSKQGVMVWNFGKAAKVYGPALKSAAARGLDPDKPFSDYTEDDMAWLTTGEKTGFKGIAGFFAYLDRKKYRPHFRMHAARFRKYVPCKSCEGGRLGSMAIACKLTGKSLPEITALPIDGLLAWLTKIAQDLESKTIKAQSTSEELMGINEAIEEASSRAHYLRKIGGGYLTLNRSARTLSGGELQRINMARCLGSSLTGTLYCLDEPSTGLHVKDSQSLMGVIEELRDQGNTVVLVEHERHLIQGADHLVEVGPKAGHLGGELVFSGPPRPKDSALLAELPISPMTTYKNPIKIKGAKTHNLKNIDVDFPCAAMTVVCGVSGSGKTSLVQHTLYPMLVRALCQRFERNESYDPKASSLGPEKLVEIHKDVMLVSQGVLGRSSRSNIATYLGLMNELRKMFAAQGRAKQLKLKPGSFSFNTSGGRCENCKGLGTISEDLSFLGEMDVICPVCEGRRFEDDVLSVDVRGKNLIQVLALTIDEARTFFYDSPTIVKICDVIIDMGLGYITLGQSTSSFSGGEAQRLKLVSLMKEVKSTHPSILIFDEPSSGLSDQDVNQLIKQLRSLTKKGHTVVVVEHHLGVIRAADHVIEIGPGASELGGNVVFQGVPQKMIADPKSVTGPYLAPIMPK
jgi:excinuclease ABC subunit A